MTDQVRNRTGFEKWQDMLLNAANKAEWNAYDCEMQQAAMEFNHHLSATPGYLRLDWQLVKAMAWVESGAESSAWVVNPLQIGNPGDPGLTSLLTGNEGGDVVLPAALKDKLTAASVRTIPGLNIRAAIGYLLMRSANFAIKSVPDPDTTDFQITVRPGDSLDKIGRENGTTIEMLRHLNPSAQPLHPGQVLKYRKAAMKRVIVGWKPLTTTNVAVLYNVGDPKYARKLDFALKLIRNGKVAACAH